MLVPSEFAQRRQQLMQKLGNQTVAIIAATPEYLRNGDSHYPYRQNSDFYYLTGFAEPEAVAVLLPNKNGKYILFNRPRNPLMETWNGRRAGQAGAIEHYGAKEAYPISEFANKLPDILAGYQRVCYAIGQQSNLEQQIMAAVNILRSKVRTNLPAPFEFISIEPFLHEMRLYKSDAEIALMRKAAQISAQAHRRAMQVCRPGLYEYEIEAELLHEFYRQGSRFPAYGTIVGGGENSCILHYQENNAVLKAGELLLIDAGCEYHYYAADITRTFPINGHFTAEQKAIYEIVLAAQLAAIKAIHPGTNWERPQEICVQIITEGLLQLGILSGQVNELIASKAYENFYMHRSGHWLGLDVHDVGNYKVAGNWRLLEAGMTLTIEPGIYIAPNNPNVDKKWWNIGIRIEDDIVVTKNGCDVLSADAPKNIADIENIMK